MHRSILVYFAFLVFITQQSFSQKRIISGQEIRSASDSKGFGAQTVFLGDINGDLKNDIAVYDKLTYQVHVYTGTATGFSPAVYQSFDLSYWKQTPVLNKGGDINGDHFNDLIIGLPDSNKVIGFYGSGLGFPLQPSFTLVGSAANVGFGFSFDYSSDFNKDGFDDLIVSETKKLKAANAYGLVYVYYGKATGPSSSPNLTINKGGANIIFGYCIAPAGDVNRDGYEDVLISGKKNTTDIFTQGFVYCFYGSSVGLQPTVTAQQWGKFVYTTDIAYGIYSGSAGDINNDSYDDIYINNGSTKNFFWGSATGLSSTSFDFSIASATNFTFSKAGDFNKDGYGDIACLVFYTLNSKSYRKLNIYRGTSTGVETQAWFTFEYYAQRSTSMSCITSVGDHNSDGYSDLLLGEITPADSLGGRANLLLGAFNIYAKLAVENSSMCHRDNEFKFMNRSPKLYNSVKFKTEAAPVAIPTYDTIYRYAYSQPGYHYTVLTVSDANGNSHSDSVRIFSQPLFASGTYEVGAGKFFPSIPRINDSLRCGIAGPVTLNVSEGIYDDHIELGYAKNVGSFPSLTIQSVGDVNKTFIAGMTLNLYPNVHVKNIAFMDTIEQSGIYPKPVEVFDSRDVSFDNCRFQYFRNYHYLLTASNSKNLKIFNCRFSYNSDTTTRKITSKPYMYALWATQSDSIIFESNKVYLLNNDYGVDIQGKCLTVQDNYIHGYNPEDAAYNNETYIGLKISGEGVKVLRNKISGCSQGLLLMTITGKPGYNLIANNAVGGDIGEYNYSNAQHGITISSSRDLKFYHNTVHYSNRGATYNGSSFGEIRGYAFFLRTSHNIDIKNNLFVATGAETGAYCLNLQQSTNIYSDFNVMRGLLKGTGGEYTEFSNLPDFVLNVKTDTNSVMLNDLEFEYPFVLRPSNNLDTLANKLPLLSGITDDINKAPRAGIRTAVGAYNLNRVDPISEIYVNAGLLRFSGQEFHVGNNIMKVKLTNSRPESMDSVYIHYSVDGQYIAKETWKGSLRNGDSSEYTFTVPTHCPYKRLYTVKAWLEIPTSYIDLIASNDTIQREFLIAMDGNYSVLCDTCVFPTMSAANYNLKRCGVENQVIFSIKPGNYQDTIVECENGPVIYTSSTGNREDVTIRMMHFIDKKDIECRNLTIIPEKSPVGISYNLNGVLVHTSKNITFDNCVFMPGNYDNALSYVSTDHVDVRNCKFVNFKSGINFSHMPYYGSNRFYGTYQISQNEFVGTTNAIQFLGEIYSGAASVKIDRNTFTGGQTAIVFSGNEGQADITIDHNNFYTDTSAIMARSSDFYNVTISNNTIRSKAGSPIDLHGSNYGKDLYIYNNVIVAEKPTGYVQSIYFPTTEYIRFAITLEKMMSAYVFHNTCYGGIELSGQNNSTFKVTVKNNIFASQNDILSYYYPPTSGYVATNNCIYRGDQYIFGYYNFNFVSTMEALHIIDPTQEASSISSDSPLLDATFESKAMSLKGKGAPVTKLYLYDIRGVERDTLHPDLGAHVISNGVITSVASAPTSVKLFAYPNPNNGVFTVDISKINGEKIKLVVSNSNGEQVYQTALFKNGSNLTELHLSDLPAGLYLLKISSDQENAIQKIIIQ